MVDRFGFGPHSEVIEMASNDSYLLQWFVKGGVPSLGIEPARSRCTGALDEGVETYLVGRSVRPVFRRRA
jgi:hypothetical protein